MIFVGGGVATYGMLMASEAMLRDIVNFGLVAIDYAENFPKNENIIVRQDNVMRNASCVFFGGSFIMSVGVLGLFRSTKFGRMFVGKTAASVVACAKSIKDAFIYFSLSKDFVWSGRKFFRKIIGRK